MLRRHPTLFILASTQFGGAMAWASFITFFPTFALEKHGLSLVQVGVIFSAFPIGATIGSLTVGPPFEIWRDDENRSSFCPAS